MIFLLKIVKFRLYAFENILLVNDFELLFEIAK